MAKGHNPSNVIELETRDEQIQVRTGYPLIDADPAVIARRLRSKNWKARARFFNNIAVGSLDRFAFFAEHIETDHERQRYGAWFMLCCLKAIGDALRSMAVERPDSDLAAALCSLSDDPGHRQSARTFWRGAPDFHSKFRQVTRPYVGLMVLFNMVILLWPGVTWVHAEGGPPEDPVFLMRSPTITFEEWCQQNAGGQCRGPDDRPPAA